MYKRNRSQQPVYPQDIECVAEPINGKGAVFIGNLEASESIRTLIKHKIGAVLTAAKGIKLNHPKTHVPYHLHIPGQDHQRFDLSIYFDQAIQFIQMARQKTNILIHCMAGVSRSVTLFLAYLIKQKGMSFNEAFSSVKRKRRIINPNRGFIQQLQRYQKEVNSRVVVKNPENQNNKQHLQGKSLGRKNFQPQNRPNLSLDKDAIYQQQVKRYADELWPSKQNILNSHHNYSYYNNLLQRKKKANVNNYVSNNYQYNTVGTQKLANQLNNLDQFYGKNKKRATQKSFQQLNRELDKRIDDIRQKYTDLAVKTKSTGNNSLKNSSNNFINQQTFHRVVNNSVIKPASVPKKAAYTSHQGLRTSMYYDHKPFKFDYYQSSLGGVMPYRHGYDKYSSMRASYYEY